MEIDWGLVSTNEAERNLVISVCFGLEEFEHGTLGVIPEARERGAKVQYDRIVEAYVLHALWIIQHPEETQLSIDPTQSPYPFRYEAGGLEGNEDSAYILSLLSHPEIGYLTERRRRLDAEGKQFIYVSEPTKKFRQYCEFCGLVAAPPRGEPDQIVEPETVNQPTAEKVRNDLDNSRPLDVHTWSDHPEVNSLVDEIYEAHFAGGNENIRKKHVKLVLLDLYVAWSDDPDLKISYSRDVTSYKVKSRYNTLKISKLTPSIVDSLVEHGLLHHKIGFNDPRTGIGRNSRMWPTDALIEKFQHAKFGVLDVGHHADKECIVLRDEDKNNMEYVDDKDIRRMRSVLREYNEFLTKTFIDIPFLDEGWIELEPDKSDSVRRLLVNQHDKFVRRIFHRGSFEMGGRFYGGWWQRCPSEWRELIFLNDHAVSEIDYSGLHVVILYALLGINYWEDINVAPYKIEKPEFIHDEDACRAASKQLILTALNAKDEKTTFQAFRDQADTGSYFKKLTNEQLGTMLNLLREKHAPIADGFASDAGVKLMNIDGKITEFIIEHFVMENIPILTVHDSYIVPYGMEAVLEEVMAKAFEHVTGMEGGKVDEVTDRPDKWEPMSADDGTDNTTWEAVMKARHDPERSKRYQMQWGEFRERYGISSSISPVAT